MKHVRLLARVPLETQEWLIDVATLWHPESLPDDILDLGCAVAEQRFVVGPRLVG